VAPGVALGPALVKSPQTSCCRAAPSNSLKSLLAGLTDAGAGKRIAPGGGGRPPRDFAFVLVVPSPSFF